MIFLRTMEIIIRKTSLKLFLHNCVYDLYIKQSFDNFRSFDI